MNVQASNKATALRFYEGDLIRAHEGNLADYFTPSFVDHDPPGPGPAGLPGVILVMRMLAHAMPERALTMHDAIAEGDRVVVRLAIEGEQKGFFPGRERQDGPLRLDILAILRFEDGKIAERWGQVKVR